jgi:hypothetical protein
MTPTHPRDSGQDADHPALVAALDGILTESGWKKYRDDKEVGFDAEALRIIFAAGQNAGLATVAAPEVHTPEAVTLMTGVEQYNRAFDKSCGKFYSEHGRLPAPIEIFAIAATVAARAPASVQRRESKKLAIESGKCRASSVMALCDDCCAHGTCQAITAPASEQADTTASAPVCSACNGNGQYEHKGSDTRCRVCGGSGADTTASALPVEFMGKECRAPAPSHKTAVPLVGALAALEELAAGAGIAKSTEWVNKRASVVLAALADKGAQS